MKEPFAARAVREVSSVTIERSRRYRSPLGVFSFQRVPASVPRAEEKLHLLDLLERFLRATDFVALYAEHPELAGDIRCRVRLYLHESGALRWEVVSSR